MTEFVIKQADDKLNEKYIILIAYNNTTVQ